MQAYCRARTISLEISSLFPQTDIPRRRICEHQRNIQARSTQLYCEDLIDRKVDNPNLETTTAMESWNKFATAPLFSLTTSVPPSDGGSNRDSIYLSLPSSLAASITTRLPRSRFLFALLPRSFSDRQRARRAQMENGLINRSNYRSAPAN